VEEHRRRNDQPPPPVEDDAAEVARLADDGGVSGAVEVIVHLVDKAAHLVADDLNGDRIDPGSPFHGATFPGSGSDWRRDRPVPPSLPARRWSNRTARRWRAPPAWRPAAAGRARRAEWRCPGRHRTRRPARPSPRPAAPAPLPCW